MLETLWTELLNLNDPLLSVRQKYWNRFQEIGLPRPKQEAFQYLMKPPTIPAQRAEPKQGLQSPGADLVFVDGFFEGTLSSLSSLQRPSMPLFLPLDQALHSYGLFLQTRIGRTVKEEGDPFAALNGVFQGRGGFLYIPPKCKAALHLLQIFVGDHMVSPRLHIYVGRGAELQLTQTSQGTSQFCNSLFDLVLDEGASLSFIDRAEGQYQAMRATLKRDSRLKAVLLGRTTRTSLKVQLTEENSAVELLGLARLDQEAESHIHATVEHIAPHTRSRQHFKSVVTDKSRFSFEGKIHVRPEAQKTEAYQLNNNLILSDQASANAKPNLEIFADDVKASHGATVGQLDEEQLFYLRSRGLGKEQAKEWLIEGFCREITDHAR